MEVPRPQVFEQNDTRKESIFRRYQETEQNTGRARGEHRGRGDKEHNITTRYRQGTGPTVKAVRGGGVGVQMVEAGRGKKGTLERRNMG